MNAGPDVERRISDWLAEQVPSGTPDRILPAAFTTTRRTRQRRRFAAWRTTEMTRTWQLLTAAAIGLVVVALGVTALGRNGPLPWPGVGGEPSPSTSPRPTETAPSPSTSPRTSAPPVGATFTSTIHGISMGYPAGWQVRPATEPWTDGVLDFDSPAADVIFDPELGDRWYFALASRPLGPTEADGWGGLDSLPDFCAGKDRGRTGGFAGGKSTFESSPNNGAFFTVSCGSHAVEVKTDTRDYVILLYVGDEEMATTQAYGGSRPADPLWNEALDTVDLRPEEALDATLAPAPTTAPPSDADALLNGFISARVAGQGVEQYLATDPTDNQVPLRYATTSGATYEGGEFEQVVGYDWPYGWTAFKVRMFAGATVVEQLFFMSHEGGRLRLGYVPDGFGTDIAPTTEDGRPVPAKYDAFDGAVTLHIAHPWVSFGSGGGSIKLIPEGSRPTTDGGERNDWDRLDAVADPGLDCQTGPKPADAEALADGIRSRPGLEVTAPVRVHAGATEAVMIDVAVAAGQSAPCRVLYGGVNLLGAGSVSLPEGYRMRLYLYDAPAGSSMRTLAVMILVRESRFERAVSIDPPVVEFHAP